MRISDWSSDVCSSDLGRLIPFFGQVDRGLEDIGPGQLAPALVDGLHQADIAGNADRQAAGDDVHETARLAVRVEEAVGRRRGGRCFAAIDRRDLAALRVRSEEHTSELQSLMRKSYTVF